MSAETHSDYLDVYQHTLEQLLFKGLELTHSGMCEVQAQRTNYEMKMQTYLLNPPMPDEPDQHDSVHLRQMIHNTGSRMQTFALATEVALFSRRMNQSTSPEGRVTYAQLQHINQLVAKLAAHAVQEFRGMVFHDTETEEEIYIHTQEFKGQDIPFVAQQLGINWHEESAVRSLSISRIGWLHDTVKLDVQQGLYPRDDVHEDAMSDFFIKQHDDTHSYSVIISTRLKGALGVEIAGIDEVLSKYPSEEDQRLIRDFIAEQERRGKASADMQILAGDPFGLRLPTAEDLGRYVAFMDQISNQD